MVKAKINPIVKLLNGYPNEFKKSVRARGVDNKGKPISIDRKIYIVRAQNRASAQKEIEDANAADKKNFKDKMDAINTDIVSTNTVDRPSSDVLKKTVNKLKDVVK